MPPASGRVIMNNDGEPGAGGAPLVHYGQQQQPSQQPQQDERQSNYRRPPVQQQPQHISGTITAAATPYGGHGIMMNNNGGGGTAARRRTEEDNEVERVTRAQQVQPTPLFERLVTEEVQELKAYARIIESQNRRLAELEKVHGDLETRLELESRASQQLEATLEDRERQWSEKYAKLEKDRDHWKEVVQIEQTKNSRLIEQVVRKDQDIQKMLQRKYDQPRADGHLSQATVRNYRGGGGNERERIGTPNSAARSPSLDQHKSPHEILAANGSAEAVRVRNVAHTLLDFFYMR